MSTRGNAHEGLVSDLGERGLIRRIQSRLPPPPGNLLVPIGDDGAVFEPERGALQVVTTDALVEGVHFDRRFSTASDIGYKAIAVNASDVAAMGGTPTLALLSLMLPDSTPVAFVDGLVEGLLDMSARARIALAGGNIARSPGPLVVDVALVGFVRRRRVLTRAAGRAGDSIYVTGTLGGGAAGLGWLRAHAAAPVDAPDDDDLAACVRRYRRPDPRLRLGALLGRTQAARACMDLSDGLADAIRQVAAASGTGAVIDAARVPVSEGARRWFEEHGSDAVEAALGGGDDYELLFTVPARARGRLRTVLQQARGLTVTRIGELTAEPSLILRRGSVDSPLPAGFSHF